MWFFRQPINQSINQSFDQSFVAVKLNSLMLGGGGDNGVKLYPDTQQPCPIFTQLYVLTTSPRLPLPRVKKSYCVSQIKIVKSLNLDTRLFNFTAMNKSTNQWTSQSINASKSKCIAWWRKMTLVWEYSRTCSKIVSRICLFLSHF